MCVLKPIIVINILETIVLTKSLLCFNGTFSYRKYGEDPLNSKVIFNSDRKAIFRTRCSLTISCSGKSKPENYQICVITSHKPY